MKLTSNLKLRPDFLYVAPLLTVVMLLLIFFLLNSRLVVQSGLKVELPLSTSSLRQWENAHVITVTAGRTPMIFFNGEPLSLESLPIRLQQAKTRSQHVLLNADAMAAHGTLISIQDAVLSAGYQLGVGTGLKESTEPK